ncbi:FCD domain-containing protein [Phaeobacter marinintestinus]|uniref:FCD domain-containing protein n=1 Tax=Falsiphaeobacter marinintestinus TaxID=1492905 RepID=UPI0011B3CD98|nr:FCD domain-containing protein [Phaeobacter marinintestinus]
MTDASAPKTASPQTDKRAADDLFRILERKISSGELEEGAPLPPEREIVQTYGVSRTVVREAVLALSNKGLVEAKPRFRPIVRKPSADTALETIESLVRRLLVQPNGVKNLFDTRILVEAALVREAAVKANKSDIANLKTALDANLEAISDNDAFYRSDMAFHAIFFDISGNPLLPAIHRAYTAWLAPQWKQMPRMADRNRTNYDSHKAIFDAILMRDPDAAEAALRRHMTDAWTQVQMTFGDI